MNLKSDTQNVHSDNPDGEYGPGEDGVDPSIRLEGWLISLRNWEIQLGTSLLPRGHHEKARDNELNADTCKIILKN